MVDTIFSDLDVLSEDITQKYNDYLEQYRQTPPPWSDLQKVQFQASITLMEEDLDTWNEKLEKLRTKANSMKNDDKEKDQLLTRTKTWKTTHKTVFNNVKRIVLEGNGYLKILPEPKMVAATVVPTTSQPLRIPSLNIQKFNGDYLKWKPFWQRFKINVHNLPYSNVDKLDALVGLLEGEALDEISGFEIVEENYETVVLTLRERFGNQKLILKELNRNLRLIPPATSDPKSLRNTVNSISNMCRQLENYGVDIDNDQLQTEIIEKMPPKQKGELLWFQVKTQNVTTEMILEQMKECTLKAEVTSESFSKKMPFFEQKSANISQPDTSETETNAFRKPTDTAGNYNCSLCDDKFHFAAKCPNFVSADNKLKQLRSKNYCTKCALPNHETSNCRKKMICQICEGNHVWFLCTAKRSTTFVNVTKKQGMLLAKDVTIINPDTKETTDTVVIFDSGSQQSYISNELIKQLKLEQIQEEQLHVTGFGAKKSSYKSSLVKMQIKTNDGNKEVYANSTIAIAESVPLFQMDQDDSQNSSIIYKKPDILIGMDYFFDFINSFEKTNDDIISVNSIVGKILCKKILPLGTNTIASISTKRHTRTFKSSKTQKQIASTQRHHQLQMAKNKIAETVILFDPFCSQIHKNIHPQIKDDTIVSETEQFYAKKNINHQLKLNQIQPEKINTKFTPQIGSTSQKKIRHKFGRYSPSLTTVTDVTDKTKRQNNHQNEQLYGFTTTCGGEGLSQLPKKSDKNWKKSMIPYEKVIRSVTDEYIAKLTVPKDKYKSSFKNKPPERTI